MGEDVPSTDARTRERVLAAISESGPSTAADLAQALGLTAAAIRRHLDALHADGTITTRERPGPSPRRGRPARAWVLSGRGHASLPAGYDALALDAMRFLESETGGPGVERFARARVDALMSRYADRLAAAGEDPTARAEALVAGLTDDGFAASARPVGTAGGVQLCQGHCPVGKVAEAYPQFCDAEREAFSRVLGVPVQRLATLARGDDVCTTYVPAGDPSTSSRSTVPVTTGASRP